jgi:phosphatidylserine/phosphatidylglycerophosphate/cardiolipin synthase-like enzyme
MAAFIRTATRSIDIAIYSFSLCPETRQIVLDALRERADAGVSIRIAYDANTQQDMIEEAGNDICDIQTSTFVQSLGFPSKAIEGYHALMHHKYIVVDAGTPQAAVWTGSANFTDDSWRLQENNILILRSQDIAAAYEHDFYELWVDGNLAPSGEQDSGEGTLRYGGQPAYVQVNFSPGRGEWIDEAITRQIQRTTERATLAFVVLTSGDILRALLDLMARGVPVEGIYDRTQMAQVIEQWQMVPANHWKIPAFEQLVRYGRLAGKDSTQYSGNSPHDFMHNKVMVLDDVVITGSYNFSRHAQQNAENCLLIHSAPLSTTYRRYIRQIIARYAGQHEST